MHAPSHAAASAAPPAPHPPSASLPAGRPFNISYDGAALSGLVSLKSIKDINKLIAYLNAQKSYIDGMVEDDAFKEANEGEQQ